MLNAKACFATLCILTATTSHSHSAPLTGNDIRADCQAALSTYQEPTSPASSYKFGFCSGFVIAVLDLGSLLDDTISFCHPSEVTQEQAIRALLKYMDAHPEETHERAEPLAVAAFRTAWPCN
jgi:hypothetical protein